MRRKQIIENNVLDDIHNDPDVCMRLPFRRCRISCDTIHRILKDYEIYPYHVIRLEALLRCDIIILHNGIIRYTIHLPGPVNFSPKLCVVNYFFFRLIWIGFDSFSLFIT